MVAPIPFKFAAHCVFFAGQREQFMEGSKIMINAATTNKITTNSSNVNPRRLCMQHLHPQYAPSPSFVRAKKSTPPEPLPKKPPRPSITPLLRVSLPFQNHQRPHSPKIPIPPPPK